jgi:CubicO group peptidase (beta-lactamase class C family)
MTDVLRQLDGVPGCALAVVVGDEVVLSRGYGLADVERGVAATDESLYYIASATKSFTALEAAIVDRRGTLALDDPLAKHLNGVRLDPALRPADVRLRNLLTHSSGIENEPITFRLAFTGQHDPGTLWNLLSHSTAQEKAPLGVYRYTNAGYNIYGLILDRKTGKHWQDLLRDDIFAPLGMKRTTAYASLAAKEKWPQAGPYFALAADGRQRLEVEKTDATMQSAGGMFTTARDLARWLEFQLNDGKLDGKQVIDAAIVRSTHEKLVDANDSREPFGLTGYGLGWSFGRWRDRTVLHHGGDFPGFRALVSFMPDADIGVAVLVNESFVGRSVPGMASVWSYDWWLNVPEAERAAPHQLTEAVEARAKMVAGVAADRAKRAGRTWTLAHPKSFYAGRYTNELFGTVELIATGDDLHVRHGNLHCVAEPFTEPETIRYEFLPGRGQVLAFKVGEQAVERIEMGGAQYERVR